jgi:hypothetical protein
LAIEKIPSPGMHLKFVQTKVLSNPRSGQTRGCCVRVRIIIHAHKKWTTPILAGRPAKKMGCIYITEMGIDQMNMIEVLYHNRVRNFPKNRKHVNSSKTISYTQEKYPTFA